MPATMPGWSGATIALESIAALRAEGVAGRLRDAAVRPVRSRRRGGGGDARERRDRPGSDRRPGQGPRPGRRYHRSPMDAVPSAAARLLAAPAGRLPPSAVPRRRRRVDRRGSTWPPSTHRSNGRSARRPVVRADRALVRAHQPTLEAGRAARADRGGASSIDATGSRARRAVARQPSDAARRCPARPARHDLTDPRARHVQASSTRGAPSSRNSCTRRSERALAPVRRARPRDRVTEVGSAWPGEPVTYEGWAGAFLRRLGAPACGENLLIVVTWADRGVDRARRSTRSRPRATCRGRPT